MNANANISDAVGVAAAIAGTSIHSVGINADANDADDADVADNTDVADIAANEVGAASKLVPPEKA